QGHVAIAPLERVCRFGGQGVTPRELENRKAGVRRLVAYSKHRATVAADLARDKNSLGHRSRFSMKRCKSESNAAPKTSANGSLRANCPSWLACRSVARRPVRNASKNWRSRTSSKRLG